MIVIAIIAILAAILVPNYVRSKQQGMDTACKSNVTNIGTAATMYSTDNNGHYPTAITGITPNYLKTIPTCPAAGFTTYLSAAYTAVSNPDAYTVVCAGNNHSGVSDNANYPQYTSLQGLLEK